MLTSNFGGDNQFQNKIKEIHFDPFLIAYSFKEKLLENTNFTRCYEQIKNMVQVIVTTL